MAWDWWQNNMPSFLGGGGGSADASTYLTAAQAMNPALTGLSSVASASPTAATDLASSIGGSNWADALSSSSGDMNWAGLSQGLSKLTEKMGGQQQASQMSTSPSVSSTVSGGVLSPKDASSGAAALASVYANRNQLAQALIMAALQGKGRSGGGKGLLG